MYDINMKVAENVYLTLSKMAEDAGQQIGEYSAWVLGRYISDEEQVEEKDEATLAGEKVKEDELTAIKGRNVEVLEENKALRKALEEAQLENVELTEKKGVLEKDPEAKEHIAQSGAIEEVDPDGY